MTTFRQTIFGKGGNCFATCIAMLLNLPAEDVPNFVAMEDDWWDHLQEWLRERNMYAIEIDCNGGMRPVPVGTLAILMGPANRGLQHSVIAAYAGVSSDGEHGWDFKYDPHPDDTFINKADYACFVVKEVSHEREDSKNCI